MQRQAEAIQEAGREASEEETRRISEGAARLRRKQRRQEQAVRKKRSFLALTGIAVVALSLAALAVGAAINAWNGVIATATKPSSR